MFLRIASILILLLAGYCNAPGQWSMIPNPPANNGPNYYFDNNARISYKRNHIFAATNDRIFAFGRDGIYSSTNVGKSWTIVSTPSDLDVDKLNFYFANTWENSHVAAVGSHLVYTTDNGVNWTANPMPPRNTDMLINLHPTYISAVKMGGGDRMIISTNAGRNWRDLQARIEGDTGLILENFIVASQFKGNVLLVAEGWTENRWQSPKWVVLYSVDSCKSFTSTVIEGRELVPVLGFTDPEAGGWYVWCLSHNGAGDVLQFKAGNRSATKTYSDRGNKLWYKSLFNSFGAFTNQTCEHKGSYYGFVQGQLYRLPRPPQGKDWTSIDLWDITSDEKFFQDASITQKLIGNLQESSHAKREKIASAKTQFASKISRLPAGSPLSIVILAGNDRYGYDPCPLTVKKISMKDPNTVTVEVIDVCDLSENQLSYDGKKLSRGSIISIGIQNIEGHP